VAANNGDPSDPTSSCHYSQTANRRLRFLTDQFKSELKLRPTVSRPVCLGVKHPSRAQDQIFVTVRQLLVCGCGASYLTRGRVCCLQLRLVLASAEILGFESRGTHDYILLSQIRDSLNLKSQVPVFISLTNRVAQFYPRHWFCLFVALYESQGYGGSIGTRFHAGFNH
jgi:hypothetical protein